MAAKKAVPAKAKKAAPAKAATAKASAAKAAPTPVITLTQLAKDLAEKHDMPRKQVTGLLGDLTVEITKHLKKGARVRVNTIGVLQVRKRPARMGRNPATGEAIKIKASKKIAFRAAKDLKEAI
ncbi:MAG: hypothetical protein RLZ98_475 [Pseudomonadota bacterium]|jgi:DNA-binding protein HU-beta